MTCRVCKQQAEPEIVDPGIVRDDGQILDTRLLHGRDRHFRNAAQPESAGRDQQAILQDTIQRFLCAGTNLLHAFLLQGTGAGCSGRQLQSKHLPGLLPRRNRPLILLAQFRSPTDQRRV